MSRKTGNLRNAGLYFSTILGCGLSLGIASAQTAAPHPPGVVLSRAGSVDFARAEADVWYAAGDNQMLFYRERLRTREDGRAMVELEDLSRLAMNPRSELTVLPPRGGKAKTLLNVSQGLLYFLHRNQPGEIDVETPVTSAAIEGTEFVLAVNRGDGTTTVSMLDGRVRLANPFGQLTLVSGEQGVVEPGQPPRKTASIEARNIVQWFLYYPGVLAPEELGLDAATQTALRASLDAYRSGDLLKALDAYPAGRKPATTAETTYLAALNLSCGLLAEYKALAARLPADQANARALRSVVAAVQFEPRTDPAPVDHQPVATQEGATPARHSLPSAGAPSAQGVGRTASELLAHSYLQQSRHDLEGALATAREAVAVNPNFGFGWERVAELEFSFGRVNAARRALEKALVVSPRNAQAHALQGFLDLADGRMRDADAAFAGALTIDPMLGNAWLGRGLGRIRTGEITEGRADLETAAALEPNRSLLRSYLGKAFAHEARFADGVVDRGELHGLAAKEIGRAVALDPLDPTPWLYLALLKYDEYRIADAIHCLEQSQRLNDNRAVYRSRFLLDQDQAVRSANLANIFADADMKDVSVRESARAVSLDYANYSAHLNLASSFNELRDPTRFNLRYETEWFNEHLLATLLAPPGAISLSQNLSQQEYSRMFAADRFGLNSTFEYLSTGEYKETASQFGSWGGTSYALDLEYQHNDGVRPNNGLDRIEWYSRIKQRITPQDSLLLLAKYQDYESGDNFQYYDDSLARPAFYYAEQQTPMLLAGWHHEWAPGVHTLFLGGRLVNDQQLGDTNAVQMLAVVNPPGFFNPLGSPFDVEYRSDFEIYTAELNQIIQGDRHTDIFGVRYQQGTIDGYTKFTNPPLGFETLFELPSESWTENDFRRLSLYAYHHWEVIDGLMLIGGLSYDELDFPANYRRPPLSTDQTEYSKLSPKAALLWDITPGVRARFVFAQAVGGLSYDESVRLEPTQLVGFSQSFRTLISESVVGSVESPRYEIIAGALDLRPWKDAWLSFQGETLHERVDRDIGIFDFDFAQIPPASRGVAREQLDYDELNARVVFNQIIGSQLFFEAQYQFTRSELTRSLPDIPATELYIRTTSTEMDLHQFKASLTWQHPSGFFARGEFHEVIQHHGAITPEPEFTPLLPGDKLQLLNLYAGYRFPARRGEVTVGVVNLFDNDYELDPLNYHPEYPQERGLYARLKFNF